MFALDRFSHCSFVNILQTSTMALLKFNDIWYCLSSGLAVQNANHIVEIFLTTQICNKSKKSKHILCTLETIRIRLSCRNGNELAAS